MNDLELEAKFIAQEHRLIAIWTNFWIKRKEWNKEDPRRKAANTAFAMFWLPNLSTVLVSGGLVTFLTLYYLSMQTHLLEEQNRLMDKQNTLLLSQIREQQSISVAARKTELIKSIYHSNSKSSEKALYTQDLPITSSRIRSEAIAEYLHIRRNEIQYDLLKLKTSGYIPTAATLNFGIDLRWAPLQGISVDGLDMSKVSLFYSNFEAAELNFVNFSGAQMEYTNLSNADLTGANFTGTSLVGANLTGADLGSITWNNRTSIQNANIYGILNAPKGFKKWALSRGALEVFNMQEWINKNIKTYPALAKHIRSPDEK